MSVIVLGPNPLLRIGQQTIVIASDQNFNIKAMSELAK
jgi:hypothetical protein